VGVTLLFGALAIRRLAGAGHRLAPKVEQSVALASQA
jgi:hypothetical protein